MNDDDEDDTPDVPGVDRGGYWAEVVLVSRVAAQVYPSLLSSSVEEAVDVAARIIAAAQSRVSADIDETMLRIEAQQRATQGEPS